MGKEVVVVVAAATAEAAAAVNVPMEEICQNSLEDQDKADSGKFLPN